MKRSVPLAGLATALIAGAAAAATPVFVSINAGGGTLRIRPSRIHLLSNENLLDLHWQSWGGATATAAGKDHGNFPSPGHRATNPVRVEATSRHRCGSRLVYTAIRVHFTDGVPYSGQPRTTTYPFGCPS